MKKSFTIAAVAAAAMLAIGAPAQAQMSAMKAAAPVTSGAKADLVHKTGRRGRRIAAGIALGIVGAAAYAHARRHHYHRPHYSWRHERRCRRWRRWCWRGNEHACWKYDTRC